MQCRGRRNQGTENVLLNRDSHILLDSIRSDQYRFVRKEHVLGLNRQPKDRDCYRSAVQTGSSEGLSDEISRFWYVVGTVSGRLRVLPVVGLKV